MQQGEPYRLLIADAHELAGLSRRSSEGLAAQFGQSVARWHVLSVVSGGPCTVPFMARRLGLARQSVQRVVDALERDQLVALQVNPDHARSPLYVLTAAGSSVLGQIVQRADAAREQLLDGCAVSAEELTQADGVLRRVIDALRADSSVRESAAIIE